MFPQQTPGWGQNDLYALMASSHTTTLPSVTRPGTSNQKRTSVKWRYTNLLMQYPEEMMENIWVQRNQVSKARASSFSIWLVSCVTMCISLMFILVSWPAEILFFPLCCRQSFSLSRKNYKFVSAGCTWQYSLLCCENDLQNINRLEKDTSNTQMLVRGSVRGV